MPCPTYDSRALIEIPQWKERRLRHRSARLVPDRVRSRVSQVDSATRTRFEALPGVDRFESLFSDALRGLTDVSSRAARASVRREAVLRGYQKRGHDVRTIADICKLTLADIDDVKPRLDLAYIVASTVEGAGAGLAVSGGQFVLTGGAVLGPGAGAAPGAAAVITAMAADAAAVLVASHRAVAHVAAYYGYDVDDPAERVFALGVLNVGTTSDAGKAAAFVELNKIVQGLARRQTWNQLNERAVTKIVSRVYATLGMRLTQRKLAQAVPVVGIVLGAGLNARLLSRVLEDAEHAYRERFLREKYGLPLDAEIEVVFPDDVVNISEIVDAEIVEEPES